MFVGESAVSFESCSSNFKGNKKKQALLNRVSQVNRSILAGVTFFRNTIRSHKNQQIQPQHDIAINVVLRKSQDAYLRNKPITE